MYIVVKSLTQFVSNRCIIPTLKELNWLVSVSSWRQGVGSRKNSTSGKTALFDVLSWTIKGLVDKQAKTPLLLVGEEFEPVPHLLREVMRADERGRARISSPG
jgi:hypothetical protein